MKFFSLFLLITTLLTTFMVSADAKDDDGAAKLKQALALSMPGIEASKITATPITGLYEVIIGSQVVYMSVDARYMIQGDLIDWKTRTNLSEQAKAVIEEAQPAIRLAALEQLGSDQMLVYKPKKTKDIITVITDINCGYCRKLHSEIPVYLKNNIEVRYIFNSERGSADGMKKTVSVWCSDDRLSALDIAKAGGKVEEKTCDNPIKQHVALARGFGIEGTPAIILENGQLLPGYVPVDKLIAEIRK